ncbi:AbrB family transcriptional regulator [Pseudomonas sp. NFXW11]|uniref:AbrB family transcriptional regulator n=1 Tax=Pseudomonas sp. NFXW11 TaxID=2819531 RepID=UPI003CEE838E
MSPSPRLFLTRWPLALQWLAWLLLAAASGQSLKYLEIPAGQFLGPMLSAILFGVCGAAIRVPRLAFRLGQGAVGMLAAHSITLAVLQAMLQSWHVMLLATLLTVGLSTLVGLALERLGGIAASTAAWGTAPGAASAMVSMADEFGADSRVVATMQYVRVVCVVMVGALVSHWIGAPASASAAPAGAMAAHGLNAINVGLSLAAIAGGVLLGSRVPAGALLVPLLLGGALQVGGLLQISLPSWLLACAYCAIGGYIGLRFDAPTLKYVLGHLPAMIGGALLLIALCALSAWGLAHWLGKDFLSVYLATSPGGLDAMAIIAVDTHSDIGLVLALQTLRLFAVILSGAFVARLIIKWSR